MKLLFIPGFQEYQGSRDYTAVLRVFHDYGYDPLFVDINWRRTTQNDWANQLKAERSRVGFDAALAGFSFGAVTALMSAASENPSELWLFSLSPLFAENTSDWTATDKKICGKHRLEIAAKTPFAGIASRIRCPTKLLLGKNEIAKWPEMLQTFDRANNLLPNVQSRVIDGAEHDVANAAYRAAIRDMLE